MGTGSDPGPLERDTREAGELGRWFRGRITRRVEALAECRGCSPTPPQRGGRQIAADGPLASLPGGKPGHRILVDPSAEEHRSHRPILGPLIRGADGAGAGWGWGAACRTASALMCST